MGRERNTTNKHSSVLPPITSPPKWGSQKEEHNQQTQNCVGLPPGRLTPPITPARKRRLFKTLIHPPTRGFQFSFSCCRIVVTSTTCMHEKNRASVLWVRARDDNNQNTPQTYPQPQATPTHAAVNSPQTYKQTAVSRSPLRNTTELTRFVRTRGSIGGVGWVGRGTLRETHTHREGGRERV